MNWYVVVGRIIDDDNEEFVFRADSRAHAIEQFNNAIIAGMDGVDDEDIIIECIYCSRTEIFGGEIPELDPDGDWGWNTPHLPTPAPHPAADTPDPTTAASHFIT
jgi:hypothetical protein